MVKLFVIISSGMEAKGKALTGMMFAKNAKKRGLVEDLRLIFFGPSENAIAQGDSDFLAYYRDMVDAGVVSTACVKIAEDSNISASLKDVGLALEPVASVITRYASEGYQIVTF